jgi:hemerythrin-like domain-containing protein
MIGNGRKDRRAILREMTAAGAGFVLAAAGAPPRAGEEHEDEVAPAEDLMREHGVLNRVLLIYDEFLRRSSAPRPDLPPALLGDAARIIRGFIEDYHERLEEDELFPRFEKAGRQVELVRVLREQHRAGRRLTEEILEISKTSLRDPADRGRLAGALRKFAAMYRPHEAREDTVLFPEIRRIVSRHEYGALGEDFEKKEQALFGEGGFEKMVDRVAAIEKRLGIYELAKFTP